MASAKRTCTGCGQSLPLSAFPSNSAKASGVQSRCAACYAAYQRTYYQERTARDEAFRVRNRETRQARRAALVLENRSRVWGYLVAHPCVDCGEADPVVLEFDHRVPSEKAFSIGDALFRRAWAQVEAEIVKCDVRCANCHRRRTARQHGYHAYMSLGA